MGLSFTGFFAMSSRYFLNLISKLMGIPKHYHSILYIKFQIIHWGWHWLVLANPGGRAAY